MSRRIVRLRTSRMIRHGDIAQDCFEASEKPGIGFTSVTSIEPDETRDGVNMVVGKLEFFIPTPNIDWMIEEEEAPAKKAKAA